MNDRVFIEGLAVNAVIGVFDWEREVQQELLLDLEAAWDNRGPATSDDVKDALDYAAVSEWIVSWFADHQPELLETAAEELAEGLRGRFSIPWLKLTLRKPGAVANARTVGVSIERGKQP